MWDLQGTSINLKVLGVGRKKVRNHSMESDFDAMVY